MIERINQLMRKEGLSELQFAKRIGVPQSSVNGYLAGKNTPPTKFLTSVIAEFSDVSTEWLMRGKGAMYISDIPTDGDTEQVMDLKVQITQLTAELARLTDKIAMMEKEAAYLEKENKALSANLEKSDKRLDKLLDLLNQDQTPSFSLAADKRVPYHADSTLKE